ncbi:hypothetical protein KP77_29790 [Jeotgalibacillus alimentarius]|uniref:Adenosylcobinamide kinase n=1 Tax=Jeotgalibacillus alimentarius TaxID=135826 RepID=A0A0C2R173_9BACL|nr:bifunctional adenosylcobinamide kinase/adenosylcobinamide-phosphate guanylyltransferase [Jeotgalibacillus alimentarius]KIL44030.1 hypothetical protein KP77_29790 [Jeotgalibacillus alimentarius]
MGTVTTVIGGARSGKTAWAEREALSRHDKTGAPLIYLASGVAFDQEMKQRITRHQKDRQNQHWLTIEQPVNLTGAIAKCPVGAIVVWDCVTTWLTNELMQKTEKSRMLHDLTMFLRTVRMHADLYIISNEVLSEPVFIEGFTAAYQQLIGEVHQVLVKESNHAIEMEAGLALVRKGGAADDS